MIIILMVVCLCIGMCACNNSETTQPELKPVEKVEWHDLFDEYANIAAVQEYVGKETTFFGRVTDIAVDYCTMDVAHSVKKSVRIYMETKILADLSVGELLVVTGIVSAAGEYNYKIINARIEDKTAEDAFIREFIGDVFNGFPVWMIDNYNMHIVGQYVEENKDNYVFSGQEEADTYLADTWDVCRFYSFGYSSYFPDVKLDVRSEQVYVENKLQDGDFETTWFDDGTVHISHISREVADSGDVYKISKNYCLVKCYSILTSAHDNTWCILGRSNE